MDLSLEQLSDWLHRYFHAWQSNNAGDVAALFAEDAVYFYGPFREPARGRQTIVANWISDPQGQLDVTYKFEALATAGDLGIAHWHVQFETASEPGRRTELDGILVLKFNAALECIEHREWYASPPGVLREGARKKGEPLWSKGRLSSCLTTGKDIPKDRGRGADAGVV